MTDINTTALQTLPPDAIALKIENESIMALALAHPRDYKRVAADIGAQLEAFPEIAEKAIYSRPVGKETYCRSCGQAVEYRARECVCPKRGPLAERPVFASGLSVRAAEMIAEAYRFNRVRCSARPQGPDLVLIMAVFVDYQNGRTWEQEIPVSRLAKKRSGETYRLSDERFELLVKAKSSIAIREVILRSVPPGLRAQLERKVRESLRLPPERVAKIVATFGAKGVAPEQLEQFLGRSAAAWTNEDRVRLLEALNALEEGEATVESLFAPDAAEGPSAPAEPEAKKSTAERAKEKLKGKAAPKRDAEPEFFQPDEGDGPPPGFDNTEAS